MTYTIPDHEQRQAALNPQKSFIVQAPAGSGKTELLAQRFLKLLCYVKQPEEILAITFTKKSASEMRTRIINTLSRVVNTSEPEAPHAKTTWHLAKAALHRNQLLSWNLLNNPNRLRIQTIDSFNAYLTRQLPILAHFGAPPDITDDPMPLYQAAAQEFLLSLEEDNEWSFSIAQLLSHVDNDLNKLEALLIHLLQKRDQWLPHILLNTNNPELRKKLEGSLSEIIVDAMTHLQNKFPKEYSTELLTLANFAAHQLAKENPHSSIMHCLDLKNFPGIEIVDKSAWEGLAELLLTKDFEWRKQVNKSIGFPAPSSTKNAEEKRLFDAMKQRMLILIEKLKAYPDLIPAFRELQLTPDTEYSETQWQILRALHQVLCVLVAQLKLVFQQRGKIDYIENAQAALNALGNEDMPTDKALVLDYQLQHILIDEFQDTSSSQYRLIEKLTAGWEPDDGRTLFVVGDPMQSIYRFREAEVGYFIRARHRGLNHIHLEPLTLSVNFRSVPGIVHWLNQHFQKILPKDEEIATGAVSYSASIANSDETDTQAVTLHPLINTTPQIQAASIVQLIQKIKIDHSKKNKTIAILVRSRTHLTSIIPALKMNNISYKAIDIDPLSTRPVIQDLMALTRALLHPADRIAWLALLRGPWCGLTLHDLLILTDNHSTITLVEQLKNEICLQKLSSDSQQRLARILPVLQLALLDRYRYPLRAWLENTWVALGGPACTEMPDDLEDAKAYFDLLEKLDKNGDFPDSQALEHHVNLLYATPQHHTDNTLQIMTIHNAKGLEFDIVILPHLERKSPNEDKQLLLWMERPRPTKNNALIIAPVHAVGESDDAIYQYIKRQHAIKNDYETGRLLYVAATRPKQQLHLFFSCTQENDKIINPPSNSLLEKLWRSITPAELSFLETPDTPLFSLAKKDRRIRRLTLDWINPIKETTLRHPIAYHLKKKGFQLPNTVLKNMGVLIHQILQQISLHRVSWWTSQSLETKTPYVKHQLLQSGVLPSQLPTAIKNVFKAIDQTLQDPRGQWILQAHLEAQTELQLTALIDNKIKAIIIDRTFIDESGIRWVIDYKTAAFAGENEEQFLQEAQEKYSQQLVDYATALRAIDTRPIRLGLYFPMLPAWREWEYAEVFTP
jgi:ATP-dependent exoDNAse (exonuclease V) beta subunit